MPYLMCEFINFSLYMYKNESLYYFEVCLIKIFTTVKKNQSSTSMGLGLLKSCHCLKKLKSQI